MALITLASLIQAGRPTSDRLCQCPASLRNVVQRAVRISTAPPALIRQTAVVRLSALQRPLQHQLACRPKFGQAAWLISASPTSWKRIHSRLVARLLSGQRNYLQHDQRAAPGFVSTPPGLHAQAMQYIRPTAVARSDSSPAVQAQMNDARLAYAPVQQALHGERGLTAVMIVPPWLFQLSRAFTAFPRSAESRQRNGCRYRRLNSDAAIHWRSAGLAVVSGVADLTVRVTTSSFTLLGPEAAGVSPQVAHGSDTPLRRSPAKAFSLRGQAYIS